MATDCLVPDGDCTANSPCGLWPTALAVTDPVIPKCQDVDLTDGTYTFATIVVDNGCITEITAGEVPVYTPDECCPTTTGSSGTGTRGPKGDTGSAATIAVAQEVLQGTTWALTNIGTSSAAIIQLTVPKEDDPDVSATGITGSVDGLVVNKGLVTDLPVAIVSSVTGSVSGAYASDIILTVAPSASDLTVFNVGLNLDVFRNKIIAYVDAQDKTLQDQIDALKDRCTALETKLASAVDRIATLEAKVAALGG